MKHLKTCAVVGSALLISLALLALPTSPRTYFVLASPGNDNYGGSCIYHVDINYMIDATQESVSFWGTGETQYVSEGAVLSTIQAVVYIDNAYAATEYAAVANTRIHVLLKDPSEGTVYDNVLPVVGSSGKLDNRWYVVYNTPELGEALVTGKYTVTITYEIYIEPE